MFRKILVAHDGSEGASRAFATALDLAQLSRADLHTISIIEVHSHFAATMGEVMEEKEEENKLYAQTKQEAEQLAVARGIPFQAVIQTGHEVESIIRHAREGGYDLLVVGFMGHSKVFGRIWGGTSQNLAKLAPCSVLIVK
ncbi:MAG: universal stress protein [Acidobacteria bacterium]|nr:universal stress protein [Acidobacteriota bacterium]